MNRKQRRRLRRLAGADRFADYETAMELAMDERRADSRMAERGIPLADFENAAGFLPHERRPMSQMEKDLAPGGTLPCRVEVDGKPCGKPSPARGRYTGICADHRAAQREQNGRGLGASETLGKSTLAELFAPGQRIPELDNDDLNELADLVLEALAARRGHDLEIVITGDDERRIEIAQELVKAQQRATHLAGDLSEAYVLFEEIVHEDD